MLGTAGRVGRVGHPNKQRPRAGAVSGLHDGQEPRLRGHQIDRALQTVESVETQHRSSIRLDALAGVLPAAAEPGALANGAGGADEGPTDEPGDQDAHYSAADKKGTRLNLSSFCRILSGGGLHRPPPCVFRNLSLNADP